MWSSEETETPKDSNGGGNSGVGGSDSRNSNDEC